MTHLQIQMTSEFIDYLVSKNHKYICSAGEKTIIQLKEACLENTSLFMKETWFPLKEIPNYVLSFESYGFSLLNKRTQESLISEHRVSILKKYSTEVQKVYFQEALSDQEVKNLSIEMIKQTNPGGGFYVHASTRNTHDNCIASIENALINNCSEGLFSFVKRYYEIDSKARSSAEKAFDITRLRTDNISTEVLSIINNPTQEDLIRKLEKDPDFLTRVKKLYVSNI